MTLKCENHEKFRNLVIILFERPKFEFLDIKRFEIIRLLKQI